MRKIIILSLLCMVLASIVGCGGTDAVQAEVSAEFPLGDSAEEEVTQTVPETVTMVETDVGNVPAEYARCTLVLDGADMPGDGFVYIQATYTNDNEEPLYALCSFVVKAFQNDRELADASDINGAEASLITEVMDGQSLAVSYCFRCEDDSPVTVMVCTPTADADILSSAVY